jgi:hypothetical protein
MSFNHNYKLIQINIENEKSINFFLSILEKTKLFILILYL